MHVFSRTQAEEKTWHVRSSTLQVQFYRSEKELLIRGHDKTYPPFPATCAHIFSGSKLSSRGSELQSPYYLRVYSFVEVDKRIQRC